MNFDKEIFNELLKNFDLIEKLIKRKNASKQYNIKKVREYKIINTYNKILKQRNQCINDKSIEQEEVEKDFLEIRESLKECLEILNSDYTVPIEKSKPIVAEEQINEELNISIEDNGNSDKEDNNKQVIDNINRNEKIDDTIHIDNTNENKELKMANAAKIEYLKFAAKQISKFDGDPLKLNSFLLEIQEVRSVSENEQLPILLNHILTKLEGKALESVPEKPDTIDEIIEALKKNIKPPSSKIIEGRMLGLKAIQNNIQNYTKEAEQLAEALQRSLIVEGISQKKAKEMTIERTIDMCKANARTDYVKSVLAATSFEDSREVVAKFVVESTNESKEKQILTFRSNNQNRFRRGNPNLNRYQRNTYNFRRNFNNRGNFNNNFNRNQNNNYPNNYLNNYRNNRGNYRGRYNNYRGRGNSNNNYNVRRLENYQAPQSLTLGAANQNTVNE